MTFTLPVKTETQGGCIVAPRILRCMHECLQSLSGRVDGVIVIHNTFTASHFMDFGVFNKTSIL